MASGGNMVMPLTYDGSASEKTVLCGFTPRTVCVVNLTDGSEVSTSDHMQKHPTVASRGGLKVNGADGARSWLAAAAGITIVDGGFTVGTDAACNADGVQYHAIVTN